jgi:hypothetical protein
MWACSLCRNLFSLQIIPSGALCMYYCYACSVNAAFENYKQFHFSMCECFSVVMIFVFCGMVYHMKKLCNSYIRKLCVVRSRISLKPWICLFPRWEICCGHVRPRTFFCSPVWIICTIYRLHVSGGFGYMRFTSVWDFGNSSRDRPFGIQLRLLSAILSVTEWIEKYVQFIFYYYKMIANLIAKESKG